MIETVCILFLLLIGHAFGDYVLQGPFLAGAKRTGPHRLFYLGAHAGIHGLIVASITMSVWLGLAEFVAHAAIDECKIRGKTSTVTDQLLHVICKALWVFLLLP